MGLAYFLNQLPLRRFGEIIIAIAKNNAEIITIDAPIGKSVKSEI